MFFPDSGRFEKKSNTTSDFSNAAGFESAFKIELMSLMTFLINQACMHKAWHKNRKVTQSNNCSQVLLKRNYRIGRDSSKNVEIFKNNTTFLIFTNVYFFSFTPLCYKMGLVKTLIDRTFKTNNTWLGFHNDIQNLFTILRKNFYPEHVLDMLLHRYVTRAVVGNDTQPSTGVEQKDLGVAQALFQDPLHRAFFGCCTTKGAQANQSIL